MNGYPEKQRLESAQSVNQPIGIKKSQSEKVCMKCGNVFTRPYRCSYSEWDCKKYCSADCYHESRKGGRSTNWKGGIKVNRGYIEVYMPEHPNSDISGYIKEHRYIMSMFLGRPLLKTEVVHHINGDRSDNRLENLQLTTRKRHTAMHMKGAVFSKEHCRKISLAKKRISGSIKRDDKGRFLGGATYGW